MINKYKALDPEDKSGLHQKADNLQKYLETSRAGYLKEYLLMETGYYLPIEDNKLGNFKEAGFSLSTWQEDSSPDSYENHYWKAALMSLEEIRKNPQAKKFAGEILSYFKKCAKAGRENIIKRNEEFAEKIKIDLAEEAKNPDIIRREKDPKVLTQQMNDKTKLLLKALDRIDEKLNSYN